MVSSVLLASPFQMTQDGAMERIFSWSLSMVGHLTWVSLMTQKWALAFAPAVVKE